MADMAPNQKCSGGDLGRNREDDNQNMAGNEVMQAPCGVAQDPNSKKRRYNRHTPHQINQMETFFRECPHPDDNQRLALGQSVGLDPLQIKFWFQNKRTQIKTLSERNEIASLKDDNDNLHAEVEKYKEALTSATCPNCGGPASPGEMSFDEHHLRMEITRLREEVHRLSGMTFNQVGNAMSVTSSNSSLSPQNRMSSHDVGVGNYGGRSGMVGEMYGRGVGAHLRSLAFADDAEKTMIVELAVAAMEELTRLALAGIPLWTPCNHGPQLNEEEYFRTFPRGIGPRLLGYKPEASRDSVTIIINHINLVEMLMDVNQWSKMFCGIVSRAATLEVLSTGVAGNYDGAMQVMSAEFQVPTPLVLTREYYFVRYCKQHPDRSCAVVDVSLDHLRPGATPRCRRRPSGCLIQELPNGHSKVTWIEHVEVDDKMLNNLYEQLVNSGFAFGAKRWVASLERQVDRLASTMIPTITPGDRCGIYMMSITGAEGRKAMLTLAGRMVVSFCSDVGASTAQAWTSLGPASDNVRVMTRKIMHDPGRPSGIVLCAATSFWLPVPPRRVFDFLRNESWRSQWDILSNGQPVSEMAHIPNGLDPGNCLSILRVNNLPNASQTNMVLQENCTDSTGSYVIYAPIDVEAINKVLSGGNPNYVALLPSGFAILPDGPGLNGGSLLTVAFQILVEASPTEKVSVGSVTSVNGLLKLTVEKIKAALMSGSTQYQI